MAEQMTVIQTTRLLARSAPIPAAPPAAILLFLAAATAVRILVAASSDFVDDEAYYRLWSLAPAWGYYDHAPMVAWWIWLGRLLAGDATLGARLLAPLSLAAGSLVLWRTAAVLYTPAVASRAVVWFNATLLIGAGGVVITPDTPLVFFWGLTIWALVELERSRNANWWLAVGVAAGLALESKYSALFLGAGIVLWLMIRADTRRWLGDWRLWAGGAIALALFAPVVAWNAAHDWVSFQKQFGRAAVKGFTPLNIFALIGMEAALLGLLITPFAAWGAKLAARDGLRPHGAGALILPATSAPFLVYLLLHSLHAAVQGNWPAPLFPAFAIMAAAAAEEIPSLSGRWRSAAQWAARWAAPLGLAAVGALYLHVIAPAAVLEAKRDPTGQMRGWTDFAARLDALKTAQGASWIAATSYALTGQLSYHMRGAPVVQVNERARYAFLPPPDPAELRKTGLYVARRRRDQAAWLRKRFASVEKIGEIDRTEKGVVVERYVAYRVQSPDQDPLAP
jgi:4-amino-4-deoxy-L-arabinose transferase-like glycosyltransferase